MELDYSKIKSGQMEAPLLRLQTLAEKDLGVIPYAHNLKFEINYADVSTIEFDVPYQVNGVINPIYNRISSYKVVYTDLYGIYVLTSPTKTGDGEKEVKNVHGYSLEEMFSKKVLYLAEGTYNFWNPVNREDTILGRILELDPSWTVGTVDPELIGRYRTFDEYNSDALSFCYGDAAEKFRCVMVFDVYRKRINAYSAGNNRGTLPIYLSYQNLVKEIKVEELTDEIATKLHLYGSDELTIRDVNPAGTDYIIDLSYFVANGDLDIKVGNSSVTLAEKYRQWQSLMISRQQYYTSLVSARASKTAQKIAQQTQLTELRGELETLTAQQSVTIQALALETTAAGKNSQQNQLDEINRRMASKQSEIKNQEDAIAGSEAQIAQYANDILAVNNELAIQKFFTGDEWHLLSRYLVESELTEESFVATEIDASISGELSKMSGSVRVVNSVIERVNTSGSTMYSLAGGTLTIANAGLSGNIIRGTLEINTSNRYVMTAYLGAVTYGGKSRQSGLVTMSGTLSQFSGDFSAVSTGDVVTYEGTSVSFTAGSSDFFFTANTTEYQKYSVAKELYDFGVEVLDEAAWPIYEFTLDSANFLFHEYFEPFKDKLELGKSIYLDLGSDGVTKANIIGVSLDFENPTDFSLLFSNRFQLKNGAEALWTQLQKASASSRKFDASKYLYNQAANKTTAISEFIENDRNAAVQRIIGAQNQTVIINGAGIQIGGDSKYQLRIVDNMLAMTDDGWKTAKLALGLFSSELGTHWGVNTDLLAGKLIIGNNMVLENPTDKGVMQFKVDSSGAWLYNSTFVLQKDSGGLMIIDPDYGLMAGTRQIFNTNGTTVTPEFLDKQGNLVFDSEGMPQNTNFYLDIRNGNAYFRGKLRAQSGQIGGFTIESDYLHAGNGSNYVAMNGSGSNANSLYAFWAGAASPANAPFWVKKNGEMKATNATFAGTITAAKLSGNLTASGSNNWIEGCGIRVGKNSAATKGYNFYVDPSGNVWMQGSLNLAAGSITWANLNSAAKTEMDNKVSAAITAMKNGLKLSVSNGTESSTITLMSNNTSISSQNIKMSGMVTFSGLQNGTTTINGACIKTGKIDAQYLNLTGAISFNSFDYSTYSTLNNTVSSASSAVSMARAAQDTANQAASVANSTNRQVSGWTYGGSTYIDGSKLMTGTVYASHLKGGSISLLDYSGQNAGSLTLQGSSSYYGQKIVMSSGAIEISASAGDLFLSGGGNSSYIQMSNGQMQLTSSRVVVHGTLYATLASSSDRRLKRNIEYGVGKLDRLFDQLKPATFQYSDDDTGKIHAGMIAQDVKSAMEELGISNMEFAALVKDRKVDSRGRMTRDEFYALCYQEFIPLCIDQIQRLKARVDELERVQTLS